MSRSPSRRMVSALGEFGLISSITNTIVDCQLPPPQGIGDDAAILRPRSGYEWLLSKDLLIQGVHFDPKLCSYWDIGYKAVAVNVSDIAAMGGNPQYLLVGIAVPATTPVIDIRNFYRGLGSLCREYQIKVIGGDTCASRKDVFISLTIMGQVKTGQALCRKGAKVGDLIYVTETLGDSKAGLQLLQKRAQRPSGQLPKSVVRFLIQRHLHPTPRVSLSRELSKHQIATAAIDLSDGLSGDLRHICQASKVGAVIDLSNIPISHQCATYAQHNHEFLMNLALHGGEDFELLFTIPQNKQKHLNRLATQLTQKVTHIGTIQHHNQGIQLKRQNGKSHVLHPHSYDHFHS